MFSIFFDGMGEDDWNELQEISQLMGLPIGSMCTFGIPMVNTHEYAKTQFYSSLKSKQKVDFDKEWANCKVEDNKGADTFFNYITYLRKNNLC